MRIAILAALIAAALLPLPRAEAQSVVGDVLAGKLVKPKVGQWAWYDLAEARGDNVYKVRLAVVGKEKVGRRTGHWLEAEVLPPEGFATVMKMLLTGPADDPKNVHRVLQRQGLEPVQELPLAKNQEDAAGDANAAKPPRESLGREDVETPKGAIKAEHVRIGEGAGAMEIWLNDDVRPMGIVRLVSPEGEMRIRDYGVGGEAGESALDRTPPPPAPVEVKVSVEDMPQAQEDQSEEAKP